MPDTARLMQLARQRLDDGVLPKLVPNTTLGGSSAGTICRLCGHPIDAGRPEIEVQWAEHAIRCSMRLHPTCHAAWLTLARTQESVATRAGASARGRHHAVQRAREVIDCQQFAVQVLGER